MVKAAYTCHIYDCGEGGMRMCMHKHAHTHAHTHTHAQARTCAHTHTHTHAHTQTHTHTQAHTYARAHTCTHAHTRTQAHTRILMRGCNCIGRCSLLTSLRIHLCPSRCSPCCTCGAGSRGPTGLGRCAGHAVGAQRECAAGVGAIRGPAVHQGACVGVCVGMGGLRCAHI